MSQIMVFSKKFCKSQVLSDTLFHKLLEKYNFPKLNQEEIQNLNRPITSTEIETIIRTLPANKAQDQMISQLNSTKNLEKS